MSTPRRSAIWNLFTETHKSDFIATCNICAQEFSYKSTTSNLMKHLQRMHPGVSLSANYTLEKPKQVDMIVIERQTENEIQVESFKVEIKSTNEGDEFHTDLQTQLLECHPPTLTPKPVVVEFEKEPNIVDCVNNRSQESHPDDLDENDFWNLQDNSDEEREFRPSPERENELELKPLSGLKKRSQIWNVFTEKPMTDCIAICNVCNQELCYRSTTNNLKKHFQRKHPNLSMRDKIELLKPKEEPSEEKYKAPLRADSSDEENERDDRDDEEEEEKFNKRKRSQIWKYFTRKKYSDYLATCNVCKKEFGYRSTTSNLKKHLDRKHPHLDIVKTEVVEVKETTPEVPIKTCLICLQNDSDEDRVFTQIINCGPEEKSYMNKIQEIMSQPVVIDESHVLCQLCIEDLEKVIQFKEKIMKAFEFWSKVEPEPEPEQESYEIDADDDNYSDLEDLEDGENLAKFTCSKCQKVFPSSSIMLKHNCSQVKKVKIIQKRNRDGEDKFYCEHCGRGFNIKWKLTKHIKKCQSNASKQFVCNMCDRVFKKAYHLREHMASHTGERNYCCNLCGKTFQRSSSRHKHMRSHNAKPGEKSKKTPFLCTICGKSFPYSNGASRHMRVHLGEKRHECHICMKKFSQTTHLKVHMRTHSGERPYGCIICGRTFSLNASLRKHMRLHVGSGDFVRIVKNLDTDLETNMEENLGNNMAPNLTTTLAASLGVIETSISDDVEETIINDDHMDTELGANITHAEVVTEDGIHVLTHHEINLEGS